MYWSLPNLQNYMFKLKQGFFDQAGPHIYQQNKNDLSLILQLGAGQLCLPFKWIHPFTIFHLSKENTNLRSFIWY